MRLSNSKRLINLRETLRAFIWSSDEIWLLIIINNCEYHCKSKTAHTLKKSLVYCVDNCVWTLFISSTYCSPATKPNNVVDIQFMFAFHISHHLECRLDIFYGLLMTYGCMTEQPMVTLNEWHFILLKCCQTI